MISNPGGFESESFQGSSTLLYLNVLKHCFYIVVLSLCVIAVEFIYLSLISNT